MTKFDLYEKEVNCSVIYNVLNIDSNDIERLVSCVGGSEFKNQIGKPHYIHGEPSFGNYTDATYEFIEWYKNLGQSNENVKIVLNSMIEDIYKEINTTCNIIKSDDPVIDKCYQKESIYKLLKKKKILTEELKIMEIADE